MIHLDPCKLIIFNDLFGLYSNKLRREIALSKLQFPKPTFDEITLCLRKIDPVLVGEPRPAIHSRLHQVIVIIYYKTLYLFISHEALDILLKERAWIRNFLVTPRPVVSVDNQIQIPKSLTPLEDFESPCSPGSSSPAQETFFTPESSSPSPGFKISVKSPRSPSLRPPSETAVLSPKSSCSSPSFSPSPKFKTVKDCVIEDWLEAFKGDLEALNFIFDQFFPPLNQYHKDPLVDGKNQFRLNFSTPYELTLEIEGSSVQIQVPETLSGVLDPLTGKITFDSPKMSVTGKYGWASLTFELYTLQYDLSTRSFHMTTVKFFTESSGIAPLAHLKPFFNRPYTAKP